MKDEDLFKYIYSLSKKQIHKRYEYLGEGISRKVYSINEDYVVKVAKNEDGIYQNRIEHYVYTHATEPLLKYLCPIVCFKPNKIIMRKAVPFSKYHKDEYIDFNEIRNEESAYNDLNKLTEDFYLDYEDIISTSSWGIYKEKNVLIDYGCTSYLGDMLYSLWFNW